MLLALRASSPDFNKLVNASFSSGSMLPALLIKCEARSIITANGCLFCFNPFAIIQGAVIVLGFALIKGAFIQ